MLTKTGVEKATGSAELSNPEETRAFAVDKTCVENAADSSPNSCIAHGIAARAWQR